MKYTPSKVELISLIVKVMHFIHSSTEIKHCSILIRGNALELSEINNTGVNISSDSRLGRTEGFQSKLIESNIKSNEYLLIIINLIKMSEVFFDIYEHKLDNILLNELAIYNREDFKV